MHFQTGGFTAFSRRRRHVAKLWAFPKDLPFMTGSMERVGVGVAGGDFPFPRRKKGGLGNPPRWLGGQSPDNEIIVCHFGAAVMLF
jgi:hypothetical protein